MVSKLVYNLFRVLTTYLYRCYNLFTEYHPSGQPKLSGLNIGEKNGTSDGTLMGLYSQQSDIDTPEAMLKSCTEQEKNEARELCQKYLGMLPDSDAKMSGSSSKDFDDVQRQRDTRWCFHSKIFFSLSSLYFGEDEPNLTTVFFFSDGWRLPTNQEKLNFQETFSDCIFDVCVGGGEAAAELAAEILNAF